MKKLVLSVMLVAFAIAVQAGEGKSCDKAAAACTKAKSEQVKSCCPSGGDKVASGACSMSKQKGKETASKPLESPKAKS
jgi:hypothetical protein